VYRDKRTPRDGWAQNVSVSLSPSGTVRINAKGRVPRPPQTHFDGFGLGSGVERYLGVELNADAGGAAAGQCGEQVMVAGRCTTPKPWKLICK
jgi:hypothetical protein